MACWRSCVFLLLATGACAPNEDGFGSGTSPMITADGGDSSAATGEQTGTDDGSVMTSGGSSGAATDSVEGTSAGTTGDGDGTTTGPPPGGSSGDPPPPPPMVYGPCDESCETECLELLIGNMCMPPCDGTNESCPDAPPGPNPPAPICVPGLDNHCLLNCEAPSQECPAPMQCAEITVSGMFTVYRCLWPS